MSKFNYQIFGLLIRSSLEIPGLDEIHSEYTDVNILFGPTPDHIADLVLSGVLFESSRDEFLLKLPNVGNYYVKAGNLIVIDPKPNATPDELRLFLLGSVFGAILYQRGFTPLHGSSVKVRGKAIIIIGRSASGKSTLAASLVQSGYPLISDDLSAILKNSGICVIFPGTPFIKLWKDTKDLLFPEEYYKRVRPQINKFNIPSNAHSDDSNGVEIQTIIHLEASKTNSYHTESVNGACKLPILREHLFRDQFVTGMGMMNHHFDLLSSLSNQAKIYHVRRPSLPLDIETLKKLIINEILEK